MNAPLLTGCYAVVVAWWLPRLLTRLTAGGISARLGLAAWVAAMASVLTCAMAAVQFLVNAAIGNWPWLAEAVCRSVTGRACAAAVYRSAMFELGLSVAGLALRAPGAAGSAADPRPRRGGQDHRPQPVRGRLRRGAR